MTWIKGLEELATRLHRIENLMLDEDETLHLRALRALRRARGDLERQIQMEKNSVDGEP